MREPSILLIKEIRPATADITIHHTNGPVILHSQITVETMALRYVTHDQVVSTRTTIDQRVEELRQLRLPSRH